MRSNRNRFRTAPAAGLLSLLVACGGTPAPIATITETPFIPVVATATETVAPPTAGPTETATATMTPTAAPDAWKTFSPIAAVTERAQQIFQLGAQAGRDAHVFSKIGDCQNITTYFLAQFDKPANYNLGPYPDLQGTIDWYAGSFGRKSLAVRGGQNVAAVLSSIWADPKICLSGENPLACEIRVNNPSVVLISFEEDWNGDVAKYETYYRQVIEYVISQNVVPIIATKADNLEGGDRINTIIAGLAAEYDIPLWNFWAAVQWLPTKGLIEDGFHLTQGDFFVFDRPQSEWSGWTERNLTALQSLDSVRRGLIP